MRSEKDVRIRYAHVFKPGLTPAGSEAHAVGLENDSSSLFHCYRQSPALNAGASRPSFRREDR